MDTSCLPLIEVFAAVPDFRRRAGKRHALPAVLSLACAAMLCGYRSYGAMSEWGRHYGVELATALGFKAGRTPCAATFYNIFQGVDWVALEQAVGQWAQAVLAATAAGPEAGREPLRELEAVAVDGKTLRGSARQGAVEVHLLSAVSHRLGLTLQQVAVADKTNEITAVQEVLRQLVLEGRVLTMDALLTQRAVAATIVEKGGTTSCPSRLINPPCAPPLRTSSPSPA